MIRKDFHGFLYEDAMNELHSIIGTVRKARVSEQAEFITGFGSIRSGAMGLFLEYGLRPHLGNGALGKITVTIE